MLFFLINWLNEIGVNVPAVFEYSSTRIIFAAVTSLLISILLGGKFIGKLKELKVGGRVRTEDCPKLAEFHKKKEAVPTMGGILIIFAMLVSMFLWMDLKHSFTLILFLTTISLGGIGAFDDYLKLKSRNSKGISAKKKFLGQTIFALFLALYLLTPFSELFHTGDWFEPPTAKETVQIVDGKAETNILSTKEYASRLYVPFFKNPVHLGLVLMALFIMFVVVGSSNAVNLTDGLDGLAIGCTLLVAAPFLLIAFVSNHFGIASYLNLIYIKGSSEIAIYLAALIGACLGFLWYNGYPAQVFMGDTGSLALGGILGVIAVLLRRELLLGIVGGLFVAEALSVILQVLSYKFRNKRRIFLCAPLHHHFEYKGFKESKIVIRFWIIGLLLAIIGIASIKFQ